MKIAGTAACCLIVVMGCGGETVETAQVNTAEAATATGVPEVQQAAAAVTSSDPCAPLEAGMTRYDTAGTPFSFSFEIPAGFTVREMHQGSVSTADVTLNLDGAGGDDYVLRLSQNNDLTEKTSHLVKAWKAHPWTEKVLEQDVGGRTMFIHRSRIGDMVNFVAYVPSPADPSAWHMVMAGVTSAPTPCGDQAADSIETMLTSFEANSRMSATPVS